jgi:hypothetical protein
MENNNAYACCINKIQVTDNTYLMQVHHKNASLFEHSVQRAAILDVYDGIDP